MSLAARLQHDGGPPRATVTAHALAAASAARAGRPEPAVAMLQRMAAGMTHHGLRFHLALLPAPDLPALRQLAVDRGLELAASCLEPQVPVLMPERLRTVTLTARERVAGGERLTVRLPEVLVPHAGSIDLADDDGRSLAVAEVHGARLLLTFTDHAARLESLAGEFVMDVRLAASAVEPGETVDLSLIAAGETVSASVSVLPPERRTTGPRHYGYWTDTIHQDDLEPSGALQWRVVTGVGPHDRPVVRGRAGPGHVVDCDSFAARLQTGFGPGGEATEARPLPSEAVAVHRCDAEGYAVSLPEVGADQAVMLLYSSSVTVAGAEVYESHAELETGGSVVVLESDTERARATGAVTTAVPGDGAPASSRARDRDSAERSVSQQARVPGWLVPTALAFLAGAGVLLLAARRRGGQEPARPRPVDAPSGA